MTETITSPLHPPDIEQIPAETADTQGMETSPIILDAALAASAADSTDPDAPVAPPAPIVPLVPAGQPLREEDELDELIIEDFTIDGICGVY